MKSTTKNTNSTRLKNRKGDPEGVTRYGRPAKAELAIGDAKHLEAIDKHIHKHLGKVEHVLHEIYSEYVHIDVHVVKPTKKKPYWFLVTSGMSDKPMTTPKGAEELAYAEIAIALPAWWKLDEKSLKNTRWYWPIRWMKTLARFPHVYETWLFYMHTIPLSDVERAKGTKFTGVILGYDSELPEKFGRLKIGKKTVHFMTPIPVFEDEMNFRLEHGPEALSDILSVPEIAKTDTYDPKRPNAYKLFAAFDTKAKPKSARTNPTKPKPRRKK